MRIIPGVMPAKPAATFLDLLVHPHSTYAHTALVALPTEAKDQALAHFNRLIKEHNEAVQQGARMAIDEL